MRRIALCIGNNEYSVLSSLSCAVSDARAISEALERIGFEIKLATNLNRTDLNNEIIGFCESLKNYDLGLLYYAGHGFQCDSDNILAPIDLNIEKRPAEVRMDAFPLSELMQLMGRSVETTKIVILDACRESLGYRGAFRDFSPMIAPQGSLIAFSTSPGQTARENTSTNHGKYTEILLKYIDLPRVPVETVFKKVREQLAAQTGGGQIPWEHTSLIGDVYLNPDTIYDGTSYGESALADCRFKFRPDSQISEIVDLLKHQNWPTQEEGIKKINTIEFQTAGIDELFVLGRNLTQAAEGSSFATHHFVDGFNKNMIIPIEAKQHILNGMAYEIYYDSTNNLRAAYKTRILIPVIKMLESDDFFSSREFISGCLSSVDDRPIYIPGQNEIIDVVVNSSLLSKPSSDYAVVQKVETIVIKGKTCFKTEESAASVPNRITGFQRFEKKVCESLAAPSDYARFHYSIPTDLDQTGFCFPTYGFILKYETGI